MTSDIYHTLKFSTPFKYEYKNLLCSATGVVIKSTKVVSEIKGKCSEELNFVTDGKSKAIGVGCSFTTVINNLRPKYTLTGQLAT